jgi:hypothetical protein
MLLRTDKKEDQRGRARQHLRTYFGNDVQTDVVITSVIQQIQRHNEQPGDKPKLHPIEKPSNRRRVYVMTILGKLFRVTYDNRHKELEDIQPVTE